MPAFEAHAAPLWCIGGTEAGGLTGLAADLATAQDLQVPAALIVSAITVQPAAGNSIIQPVDGALLCAQLDSLLQQGAPEVIKIGLLANQQQLALLADWLAQLRRVQQSASDGKVSWVIWDPVLSSSLGQPLTDIRDAGPLLRQTDLLTPNRTELASLARQTTAVTSAADVASSALSSAPTSSLATELACLQLWSTGVKAIWCKDGHGADPAQLRETLYCHPASSPGFKQWPAAGLTDATGQAEQTGQARQALSIQLPRLAVQYRGTGCSLASAIGCALCQPMLLPDAVFVASLYLQQALRLVPLRPGQLPRPGWPAAAALPLPLVLSTDSTNLSDNPGSANLTPLRFARLTRAPGIYPVLSSLEQLNAVATTGISTVQLRLKDLPAPELRQQISAAIALGRQHQLQLFINDHWQLALELGAYGVHLGQEDLQTADLAALAQAGLRLGISTHGYLELWQALQLRPSYVALGHVFATPTKQMPSLPQGLASIARQQRWCDAADIPSVAIGGISALELASVHACGVDGVAVVRAVTAYIDPIRQTPAPASACRRLLQQWEQLCQSTHH